VTLKSRKFQSKEKGLGVTCIMVGCSLECSKALALVVDIIDKAGQ
jgi:hypothetical protein